MTFREFRFLVYSDLFRYTGHATTKAFCSQYIQTPGFRYSFYMRLCRYLATHPFFRFGPRQIVSFILVRLEIRYGISIPYMTRIGPGLYIGHFGGIVINPDVVLGRNCNLSQGVTIGQSNRGARKGCPTLGDNIYIGPGAVLIGRIKIGNNAAIGANSVVTRDVPDHAVVVGIPATVISLNGSADYVNRTSYPERGH